MQFEHLNEEPQLSPECSPWMGLSVKSPKSLRRSLLAAGGLVNALVITLLPNKSASPPRRLLIGCAGAGCALNRKLSTGGGGAPEENADEKSANSFVTGATGAAGLGGATELPPKAEAKSPKSAGGSSARGSKSSIGSVEEAELKISSIISLLLFDVVAFVGTGSSPNKFSLCVLR